VNALVCFLPLIGVAAVLPLPAGRIHAVRIVTLAALAAAVLATPFAASGPQVGKDFLLQEPEALTIALATALTCAFLLVVTARGLAGKGEMTWTLLLLGALQLGCFTSARVIVVAVTPLIFLATSMVLQLRAQEGRDRAVRILSSVGAIATLLGIASLAFPEGSTLRSTLWFLYCVVVLGGFPFHFWLPRVLSGSPFLGAALGCVVFGRFAALVLLHFPPAGIGTLPVVFGLAGMLWCSFAAVAAEDLRERIGYFAGIQAGFALYAFGCGVPRLGVLYLLATLPPILMWALAACIVFDRIKFLTLRRLHGLATQLPRLNLALIVGGFGLSVLPGTVGFPGLCLLLERIKGTPALWVALTAVAATFLVCGSTYVRIAFGEVAEELRRAGDLNARELVSMILLGLLTLSGLVPVAAALLRKLAAQ